MDAATPLSTRRYRWAPVFVGSAGFALLTIFMWHSNRPMRWERPIISEVDRIPIPAHSFWISLFAPVPFVVMTAVVACVGAALGRIRVALAGLVGCAAAILAAELVFKPLVDRYRTHEAGYHYVIRVGGQMFPSVHVTAAAALAMFAWLVLDRSALAAPFLALVPLLVAGAAISEQLHYPADVVGGMLLGSIVVYCTVAVVNTLMDSIEPTSDTNEHSRENA